MIRPTGEMSDQQDDMELVQQACDGNKRAFELLVERHYDRIFRMAFKWCRNQSDAEDVAQNACIKLARAIHQFSGRAAFTTWLYRLVINTAIDWQRQNIRSDTDALDPDSATMGSVAAGAETRLIANDDMARVLALPEKEKTALLLVFGEGLSHAEAAVIMDVRESTVSWYIHEARKKLGVKPQGKEHRNG